MGKGSGGVEQSYFFENFIYPYHQTPVSFVFLSFYSSLYFSYPSSLEVPGVTSFPENVLVLSDRIDFTDQFLPLASLLKKTENEDRTCNPTLIDTYNIIRRSRPNLLLSFRFRLDGEQKYGGCSYPKCKRLPM